MGTTLSEQAVGRALLTAVIGQGAVCPTQRSMVCISSLPAYSKYRFSQPVLVSADKKEEVVRRRCRDSQTGCWWNLQPDVPADAVFRDGRAGRSPPGAAPNVHPRLLKGRKPGPRASGCWVGHRASMKGVGKSGEFPAADGGDGPRRGRSRPAGSGQVKEENDEKTLC